MIEMKAKIAKGLWCRLFWDGEKVICEWDPIPPRRWTRLVRRNYENARDQFLQALAEHLDGEVLVIDL